MTADATDPTPPGPPAGVDLDEAMSVLLDPIVDLASAVRYSGAKLLGMLLRQEYERGYTAGQAAQRLVSRPVGYNFVPGDPIRLRDLQR